MTKIDDGGPAFPTERTAYLEGLPGMTLRQWFAGQALAGLCASASGIGIPSDEMAGIAYSRADAMIAEGSNKDGAE